MNTGPGWECHPVVPPGAYSCCRTTISSGDLAFASKSTSSVSTLNAAYVPRASSIALTPMAGCAHAKTLQTTTTIASRIEARIVVFIAPPLRKVRPDATGVSPSAATSEEEQSCSSLLTGRSCRGREPGRSEEHTSELQ